MIYSHIKRLKKPAGQERGDPAGVVREDFEQKALGGVGGRQRLVDVTTDSRKGKPPLLSIVWFRLSPRLRLVSWFTS